MTMRDSRGRFVRGGGAAAAGGGAPVLGPGAGAQELPGSGVQVGFKVRVVDESARVVAKTKAATITSLGRAAAYVRGIARKSISKRKTGKPSEPGKPPRSPTGRLHGSIAFNVDKAAGVAVIGPARAAIALIGNTHEFGGKEPPRQARARGKLWAELRVGGRGPIRYVRRRGKPQMTFAPLVSLAQVQRAKGIVAQLELPPSQTGAPTTNDRVYPPRPFMGPALRRSRDRLPAFWRNTVRGG